MNLTAQAVGNGLSLVADNLQAKGRVNKPQGEFWTSHPDGGYDVKETSSAAHFTESLLLQRKLLPAAVIITVLQIRKIRRIMLMLLE